MLFGPTAPLPALIAWCRALRHGLDVGLSPVKVFRQQATSGPATLRPVADRVADRLDTGESLQDALKPEAAKFPALFVEMVAVGEQAGRLPDVFGELEEHFETVKATRKAFVQMLIWPAIQYVGAIGVIFIMLVVLGMFGSNLDPLGLGLTGTKGAFAFLFGAVTFTTLLVGGFLYVAGNVELRAKLESFALGLPVLSWCFRSLALNRFCLAYHMTSEAGLRADRCLKFSLKATANRAYTAFADRAAKDARRGEEVVTVLSNCGPRLFPDEFMANVQVGEDSGRLAEVMKKQAAFYRDEARRAMKTLANVAGGAVYAMVGVLLVVMIFKIFFTAYLGPMQDAQKAIDNPDAWMRGN